MEFYEKAQELISKGIPFFKIRELKSPYIIYKLKLYDLEEARKLYQDFMTKFREELKEMVGKYEYG
ncbi:MAG: hypothetical protein QW354_03865, partial [Desulfurococcaceae archaeon]